MHVCCLVFPSENEFDSNGVVQTGIMNPAKSGEAVDRLLEERPREKHGHSDVTADSR